MLQIKYDSNVVYNFPKYYLSDESWYRDAEISTKKYFVDIIKPNFNIIDAGAQIGMYTILFSKLATEGNIHAFEPTDTINLLSENLVYNNCNNVKLNNLALSNKDGLYHDTIYKIWSQDVVETKEHEFITIDTYVKNNSINIDLIKIDVDSYDFEVLQGCKNVLLEQNPLVVVELNHALSKRGYEPKQAIDFMNLLGYNVKQILDLENYLFIKDK